MKEQKRYKWKRILRLALWSAGGVTLFVLLLSAMHRNSRLICAGSEILIEGYNHEMFISEKDVKKMLEDELENKIDGRVIEHINLRQLERSLQTNPWISKAQIFIDNEQILRVTIAERMPVARVFTKGGNSYYVDSAAVILPLSINEIANVPVFTNMPEAHGIVSASDSLLWKQVGEMGNYIRKEPLLLLQLGQIDLVANAGYVMYPAIGNHIILFGTADNYSGKLQRLAMFYRKILGKVGLNKYEILDLRYDKQVVATLRGTEEADTDSAGAMKKFEELVNRTVMEANDTAYKMEPDNNEKMRQESITSASLQPDAVPVANDNTVKENNNGSNNNNNTSESKKSESRMLMQEAPPAKPIKKVKQVQVQPKQAIITQKQKPMVPTKKSNEPQTIIIKPRVVPLTTENKQPKAIMPKKNNK